MKVRFVFLLPLVFCGGLLIAQQTRQPVRGYLSPATAPNFATVLPPAPHAGDVRDEQDQAAFRATRSLKGTPRWTLAQQDNASSVADLLQAFSCSVGADLTPQDAPRLSAMLARVAKDNSTINREVKNQYGRKRPFVTQSGDICIARSAELISSYDYPSGHATLGWLTGLVLAEMDPDHVGPILTRARAYGESRVVCGVHSASAVEGGRTLASAIFAALQSAPEVHTDLAASELEVKQLTSSGKAASPKGCAAERSLTQSSPYSSLPSAAPVPPASQSK